MVYEDIDGKKEGEKLVKPIKIFLLIIVLFCFGGSFF